MFVDIIFSKPERSDEDIEKMLELHKNLIYTFLTSKNLLGNANAESAGWQGLLSAIKKYDPGMDCCFSSFAYPCIKNAVYVSLRTPKKIEAETSYEGYVELNPDITSGYSIEESIIQKEACSNIYAVVHKLLNSLPTDSMKYKILSTWMSSDFTYDWVQIGTICGCTRQNISRVMQWIRVYIHNELKKEKII